MLADQYGKPLGVPENPITIGAKDSNGDPVTLTVDGDGLLKVVSSVTSVTATDITVHDPVNVANKLVVNADGTIGVQLSGSNMELYGATIDDRPVANAVPIGCCFMAVQTQEMWQSDGTNWVVI